MQKLKRKPLSSRVRSTLRTLPSPLSLVEKWQRLSPLFRQTIVLTAASLLICFMLLGCASRQVNQPPLPAQAQPRVIPAFKGETPRQIILWAVDLREGWESCEYDKQVWRELYGEVKR